MSYRLAIVLACVCATTACIKAPPFQGISDDGGTGDGSNGNGDGMSGSGLEQWTLLKAAEPGAFDHFGTAIAIAGTGTTLAVGAPDEDGPDANDKPSSGAVNVFIATGDVWDHQKYVRAGDAAAGDQFGTAVALSADGNTLAIGAPDRIAQGLTNAGAVYVFVRNGAAWTQQTVLQTPSPAMNDKLGTSVALSSDGNMLVAGAPYDNNDGAAPNAGLAYVFRRTSTTWSSGVGLAASNPGDGDNFGLSVAISGDGTTVAIGAPAEDSMTSGINTTPNDGTAGTGSGAVYVYRYSASWSQQAYVKPPNTTLNEDFGRSVALSSNGYVLAVGATGEASAATGVDGAQTTGALTRSGAVFVFERSIEAWTSATTTYVKASNTGTNDRFGQAVAVSRDGTMMVIGAPGEGSKATGIDGDQLDNSMVSAGAAYLFTKTTQWQQTAYVKGSTTVIGGMFGDAVALADLVSTFAIGASGEGTSGDDSGAAYVFRDPE